MTVNSKNPLYPTWNRIRSRCYNLKNFKYHIYGARGVKMQDSWIKDFNAFLKDVGEKPSKLHHLRRKNKKKGYFKDNLEWSTWKEKRTNKRKYNYHGYGYNSSFKCWKSMMNRCYQQKSQSYKGYGGRGIDVSIEWQEFKNFYRDMGDRPKNLCLDRIDNNKGYSKENCRWITHKENSNNTRSNVFISINGVSKTVSQWSEIYKINRGTADSRIKRGWKPEDVFTIKPDIKNRISTKYKDK